MGECCFSNVRTNIHILHTSHFIIEEYKDLMIFPSWIYPDYSLSVFNILGNISRIIFSITFLGIKTQLTSNAGVTFALLQSSGISPSHRGLSNTVQGGLTMTLASALHHSEVLLAPDFPSDLKGLVFLNFWQRVALCSSRAICPCFHLLIPSMLCVSSVRSSLLTHAGLQPRLLVFLWFQRIKNK